MAGPFIVSHLRPCQECDGDGGALVWEDDPWSPGAEAVRVVGAVSCPSCESGESVVSRVAVGSLEEAKEAAWDLMHERHDAAQLSLSAARGRWAMVSEAGGSIPLPDGTVIEVSAKTWRELVKEADLPAIYQLAAERDDAAILAAWNQGNGVGHER